MAVVTVSGSPVVGTKYTVTTASSADWASVSNSTYFFDLTDKLVHYKDSTGAIIELFGAAGLSYFTEAQATAAPNATVNVDSLTAVASTTDADFAIIPKGAGAILASIPNSIATVPNVGGNKRGQYALDLQHYGQINAGTEVASGNYAAIVCGSRNTASGASSTVVNGLRNTASANDSFIASGYLNSASGLYSFVGAGQSNNATSTYATVINGYANNATSSYTFTGGFGCIASGTRSFSYGEYCYATGGYSFAIGNNNLAASDSSVAMGVYANSFNVIGRFVFGTSGSNYTTGTSQASKLVLTNLSTSATPIELAVQNTVSDARYNLTLQDNQAMRVKGSIIGKQSASLNVAAFDFDYVIVRGVGVGTTSVVVSNVNVVTNIPAWGTPTITADTARGYASIKVIGATTTNIRWSATVESVEIIYA